MFGNFFKKKQKKQSNNKGVFVASLLVHAAKMDENYTDVEKKLLKKH